MPIECRPLGVRDKPLCHDASSVIWGRPKDRASTEQGGTLGLMSRERVGTLKSYLSSVSSPSLGGCIARSLNVGATPK